VQRIETLRASEYAGRAGAREGIERANCRLHGRVVAAANGAPDVIEEGTPRLVLDVAGDLLEASVDNVRCKGSGCGHGP
jgi:hypothetical protein